MGTGSGDVRVQNRVSHHSPGSVLQIQGAQKSKAGCRFFTVPRHPPGQGGYSARSSTGTISRVLLQPFRGPQKGRFCTSHPGPKVSKSILENSLLQDGVSALGDRFYGSERVPVLSRHHRCVFTCPHCSVPSTVPPFCGGIPPLPVCGATLWAGNSPTGIYKDPCAHYCTPESKGNTTNSLFGRHSGQGSHPSPEFRQSVHHSGNTGPFRLDCQSQEILSDPQSISVLPGDGIRHREDKGSSSTRKAEDSALEDKSSYLTQKTHHSPCNEGFGGHGVHNRGNSLCPVSHTSPPKSDPELLGPISGVSGSVNGFSSHSSQRIGLVVDITIHQSGKVLSSCILDDPNNGRQSTRLGRGSLSPNSSGNLVSRGGTSPHQHSGAPCDPPLAVTLDPAPAGSSGPSTIGQCHGGGIPESSGGHAQLGSDVRVHQDSEVGGTPRSVTVSSLHPRSGKLGCRLPQQNKGGSGRVVPSSTGIRSAVPPMGSPGCGSDGIEIQSQSSGLHVPNARSTGVRGRRSRGPVARLPSSVCVSPSSSPIQTSKEVKKRGNSGNPDRSGLAQASLVRGSSRPTRRRSVASSTSQRPALAGSALSSAFTIATFNGVEIESTILKKRGFSENVVSTMMKARKPESAKIYHRVWRTFFSWCEEQLFPPLQFSLSRILSFLQRGLELGLALSSLKGQVSALSILFQKPLASRGPVKTFLQGVASIVPPYKAPVFPWDLNLVLSVLQGSPFEPIRDISLRFLSWKVVFLVAVTSLRRVSELAALSCKAPFLIFHQDKVVLRPPPEFLPKVVSGFHINEDIVLPSFCPAPSHPKEKTLHGLDVVRALRAYVTVLASFRRSDRLFIIPEGPRKGLAASKATIAKWIRCTIAEAYRVRGKTPPNHVVAHSTRAVGSSWAMQHQASAAQLCKAATWSSLHTFTKFYRVHTFASADASVGRKVLQAAVT